MKVSQTKLEGVVELEPKRFGDDRGWFSEVWNESTLATHGITTAWVQDNESLSASVGTVRGLHYQLEPNAQDKLVRVLAGAVLDVAVDLRASSSTFGEWVAIRLDADQGNQLLIPAGFGHGFCTLEPNTKVAYKVSALWAPESDCSVLWNDPDLAIEWPVSSADAVVSTKDEVAPKLHDARVFD